ncbi:MAG: diguanylate cyclase [Verrucomicrobiales bacterium]|nr:diguanylate cyclase [Verrucomicrobiales bacterium]
MSHVFYELKVSGKLPSPNGVGMKILQLTQEADSTLDEISKVIRSDPALTGRILKVAHASVGNNGSGRPSAAQLDEALLRLGFSSLRDLALGFSLLSGNARSVCQGFDYPRFWHTSLGRAVAAQQLTETRDGCAGSESYVCGLLCGIGRLGLASAHPERYTRVLESNAASDSNDLARLEVEAFGICHRELTEAMLCDWGFPKHLARAAATYDRRDEGSSDSQDRLSILRRILNLAERLATLIDKESGSSEGRQEADELRATFADLDIPADQVSPSISAIRTAWKEWSALLNLAPASTPTRTGRPVSGAATATAPAAQNSVDSPSGSAAVRKSSGTLVVLSGDDRVASTISDFIRTWEYDVLRARNTRSAVGLVLNQTPQIVVAAGTAEAMELSAALRTFEAGRSIYILLATPHHDPKRILKALEAGVDDFVILPAKEGEDVLRLRMVERALELRRRLDGREKSLQKSLAELAVANRKLRRAAMTDALTQLPNRRFAEESLKEEWAAAEERKTDLGVIFVDLDRFKSVNDTYGHLVGDLVLATIARLFREETRALDVACRYGGEEFLILCPDTDLPGVARCAERLRERVASTTIDLPGGPQSFTISLGVATRLMGPAAIPTAEALVELADQAAYVSKRTGRNRVTLATQA